MDDKKHWKHELSEQLEEEIEDANKYEDLADEADADEEYNTAHWLRVIAHEEYTHARFIHGRLENWGMLTHDQEQKWEKLERRMNQR